MRAPQLGQRGRTVSRGESLFVSRASGMALPRHGGSTTLSVTDNATNRSMIYNPIPNAPRRIWRMQTERRRCRQEGAPQDMWVKQPRRGQRQIKDAGRLTLEQRAWPPLVTRTETSALPNSLALETELGHIAARTWAAVCFPTLHMYRHTAPWFMLGQIVHAGTVAKPIASSKMERKGFFNGWIQRTYLRGSA